MSLPLRRVTNPGGYVWSYAECPLRISLSFDLIERMRAEVLKTTSPDRELGGLLIGRHSKGPGIIEILDFQPLASKPDSTSHYAISRASGLAEAMASLASQGLVAGYYRTHLGERLQLRPEDIESIQKWFKDPSNVFLVIRPREDAQETAAFFFWQGNSVFSDFSLSFPFSALRLQSADWLHQTASLSGRRLNALPGRAFSRLKDLNAAFSGKFAVMAGLIVLLILAVLFRPGGASRFLQSGPSASDSASTLGLRVQRSGFNLVIGWDRSVPEIMAAKEAHLIISDVGGQPIFVPLSPVQLRTGSVSYNSFGERVEVRLDIIGASGKPSTESMISISHAPYASIPDPSLAPIRVEPERTAALPPREQAPVHDQLLRGASVGFSKPVQPSPSPSGKVAGRTMNPDDAQPSASQSRGPETTSDAPVSIPAPTEVRSPRPEDAPVQRAPQVIPQVSPLVPSEKEESKPSEQKPLAASQPAAPISQPIPSVPTLPRPSYVAAKAVRRQQPLVPSELRQLILGENVVEIEVRIDEFGRVTSARPVSRKGSAAGFLTRPAVEAAFGWQFEPAKQNNKAVSCIQTLEFSFRSAKQ